MTNKELENKLRGVTNKDWYKSAEINFNFSKVDIDVYKKGFSSIYQYVKRQVNGWAKLDDNLPSEFTESKKRWNELLNALNSFIANHIHQDNVNRLNNEWSNINSKANNISLQYFPINCPETSFLLEVFKVSQHHYSGAKKYLVDNSSLNFSNRNEFAGAIMAYEYNFKEDSLIPKRRNSEKSSIAQVRNSFEKELSNSQQNVTDFLKTSEQNWQNITEQISSRAKDQNIKVNDLVKEKKSDYETWFEESQNNLKKFEVKSSEKISELENLYQEKLKLEAPAKYWQDRAVKLKKEGNRWLTGLIIAAIVSIVSLAVVLFFISDGTLKDLFSETGSAIRWSIVFVTFVSFLAYAIRVFAKLTFSAYHLFRDAEEREQLAYVYLALKKEKNIDDTERHLIMQSLFSRADSGLLKDDSSPTMPGGSMIEKLMGGK